MIYLKTVRVSIILAIIYSTLVGCNSEDKELFPKVITKPISLNGNYSVTSGGYLVSDGGSAVTEIGVCWNLTGDPSVSDAHVGNNSAEAEFTSIISNLELRKKYYVSAYATNGKGTGYGDVVSFRLDTSTTGLPILSDPDHLYIPGQGVTDNDGNFYPTIIIGSQEWMAENLKTTTFCEGTPIYYVDNISDWVENQPYYYYYNNDYANNEQYGKLYSSTVIHDTDNVCPCGWHVPTIKDMNYFIAILGGSFNLGALMKTTGSIETLDGLWYSPNTGATNGSGFSGKPGGYSNSLNSFSAMGIVGSWWLDSSLICYSINYNFPDLNFESRVQTHASSIRCIKD